ncbi:MAG: hypothetical protein ACJAVM_000641 [Sulfitobacter sp.]|jgi:hypothetical protein
MMSNNKILTVSYGTFSCTLEGFEDSFGTMKAIAEYFRDLASDDRYFGAEPPQPDAEMLARIAQRDVSRRVQAREQDGKIVLSALESDGQTAAPAHDVAVPSAAIAAPVETAVMPEIPVENIVITTAATEPVDVEMPDMVPGQPDAEVKAFFAEPAGGQDTAEHQQTPPSSAPVAATARVATEEAEVHAAAVHPTEVLPEATLTPAAAAPEADSIAAKLQRIRAVVAQNEEAEADEDFLEDEYAGGAATEGETAATENHDDHVDSILNTLNTESTAQEVYDDEDAEGDLTQASAAEASLSNLFDEETAKERGLDALASLDETDKAAPKPAQARVIKVKRADLEAAIAEGDLEEDHIQEPVADAKDPMETPAEVSSLSAEDEMDLANELAALDEDMAQTPAPPPTAARRVLPSIDDEKASDMNRLMAETDQQMGEPESATRRDAFAHLRAAVAAKKADVAMGETDNSDENDDAYRSDLAEVVRPRRPAQSDARTKRPGDNRPAPLKLVAEQRIDLRPSNEGPVRPRRVSAAMAETPAQSQDGDSFADYAAEMGATKLPELLEAAASYMSFVEGRDQFSRPQLMTKVRQVSSDDGFSREDGLRSFGQLLRSGKIEKIKGGRFTVSDDIGFRPGARAAG